MTKIEVTDRFYQVVEETARALYVKALKDLPPDVRQALEEAAGEETDPTGREILRTILRNVQVADEQDMLVCQDTGIPIYWVDIGTRLCVDGAKVARAINEGTKRATVDHPLRSSVCAPLTRENPQTSTGYRIPIIHHAFTEDRDYLEILMVPKGSGSENMSFLQMLIPAAGVEGLKKFVIDSVLEAGANPCPPVIVGVGIGGTSDLCMYLAKKAIARPIGSHNPDPEFAKLEDELLTAINQTGIGPMGLGGVNTALAVHIEHAHTHITQNPVAVNMQCWPARRARARITADGQVEIGY